MMYDFAPVPYRALIPDTLSDSELRFLAVLLRLWMYQNQPAKVEASDHELLEGQYDRRTRTKVHPCGLCRNTMNKARTGLEEKGFIKTEFLEERNQEHVYSYELVEGMALNKRSDGPPRPQAESRDDVQTMTVPVSNIYSLYIEEKKETSPADGGRDRRKRQPRQLSNERAEIQDKAFALLSELYPRHHPGHMELPNPGSVRSALRNFLLDNPKWGEQQVLDGIRNYYGSANTNKRTSPERWIKRIPEFSAGPLDQYGRPAGPVLVPMRVGRRSEYAPPRAAPPGAPDNYRVPDEDIQIPF